MYLTVLNTATTAQSGVVRVESGQGLARPPAAATELLTGQQLETVEDGWRLELPAEGVAVVALEPGPRFVGVDARGGAVRLQIASPPGLVQVLEASADLRHWQEVDTHRPDRPEYAIEVPVATRAERYFRLRW